MTIRRGSGLAGAPALLLAGFLALASATGAGAQTHRSVESAQRLSDAGEYARAADTLRLYLRDHPDDAGSHWMLGRLLYWLDEHEGARNAYETALRLGAADPWVRIGLARVLVALGVWDEARTALHAALEGTSDSEAVAAATAFLGSLAWWEGDDSEAMERFEEALRLDPDLPEARERLEVIRRRTRPWVSLNARVLDDNQPVRRWATSLRAGYFPDPLWEVTGTVSPRRLEGAEARTEVDGRVGMRGFLPRARLDLALEAGGTARAGGAGRRATWLGSAAARLALGGDVRIRAGGWRDRYAWTEASLDTILVVERVELALDRAAVPGWAFEAAARWERFADGNRVRAAWAWLLAPALPWLRAGYAFSWSDADETRWSAVPDGAGPQGGGPPLPGSMVDGRYDPYFTPEETVVHGLLAEVTATLRSAMARLNVNVGVRAREQAPVLISTGPTGPVELEFVRRQFTPWEAEATVEVPAGATLDIRGSLQHLATAFYHADRVTIELVRRFGAGAPSPAP